MTKATEDFFRLTPEAILDAVEAVVQKRFPGLRATGRALALNSLENRVYDVELEDDSHIVTKFYRPGRWTPEQIREEHAFLFALEEAEIPVVAPWQMDGESLFLSEQGMWFTIFPKVKGRLLDELDPERLKTLGRYIGRIHNVGERFHFKHRLSMNAENWGWKPLEYLLDSGLIDPVYEARYQMVCDHLIGQAQDALEGVPAFAVHGDCHLGNTLWQLDSPFFLDFDDAMTAPAVQDIWMVVRGRDEDAERDRDILLEGYEAFRPFDRSTLSLIEPLRALRMIHYSAWIARRWDDPAFKKAFPLFATPRYWEEEIQALQEMQAIGSEY
ncbi:MAG: serine/threonine protein kinase [Bdellovibrionota bacterium]